jgi:hypothetical protein
MWRIWQGDCIRVTRRCMLLSKLEAINSHSLLYNAVVGQVDFQIGLPHCSSGHPPLHLNGIAGLPFTHMASASAKGPPLSTLLRPFRQPVNANHWHSHSEQSTSQASRSRKNFENLSLCGLWINFCLIHEANKTYHPPLMVFEKLVDFALTSRKKLHGCNPLWRHQPRRIRQMSMPSLSDERTIVPTFFWLNSPGSINTTSMTHVVFPSPQERAFQFSSTYYEFCIRNMTIVISPL